MARAPSRLPLKLLDAVLSSRLNDRTIWRLHRPTTPCVIQRGCSSNPFGRLMPALPVPQAARNGPADEPLCTPESSMHVIYPFASRLSSATAGFASYSVPELSYRAFRARLSSMCAMSGGQRVLMSSPHYVPHTLPALCLAGRPWQAKQES